jgi:hypothetical protein
MATLGTAPETSHLQVNVYGGTRQVHVLQWMAGRHAGAAEFNPPCLIS